MLCSVLAAKSLSDCKLLEAHVSQSSSMCASNCFGTNQTTRMWLQGHFRQSALCPLYPFVPLHDETRIQKYTAFKKASWPFEFTKIHVQNMAPNRGQQPHIKSTTVDPCEDVIMTSLENKVGFAIKCFHLLVVSRVSMLDWFQLIVHDFVSNSRSEEC